MARSNLDSGDYEAKEERAILVIVKPMAQWRPRPQAMGRRHRQYGEWKSGVRLRLGSQGVNEKSIMALKQGRNI
jgi:hypothetical protein